jgi:hypothetical protein
MCQDVAEVLRFLDFVGFLSLADLALSLGSMVEPIVGLMLVRVAFWCAVPAASLSTVGVRHPRAA